jgi:hypothetical protein
MSIRAIDWVLRSDVDSASDRFVLIVLANYCNSFGLSYPSVTRIQRDTRYDRKTVQAALRRLKDKELILDSGKRTGITKQVVVYRLPWAVEEEEEVTGPIPEQFQNRNSSVPEPKQAQSEGVIGPIHPKEPSGTVKEPLEVGMDSDPIQKLKSNPIYKNIDIDRAFGKMAAWCDANHKVPTYRRFVNWLNREDKPMERPAAPKSKARYQPPAREPTDEEFKRAGEIARAELEKFRKIIRKEE